MRASANENFKQIIVSIFFECILFVDFMHTINAQISTRAHKNRISSKDTNADYWSYTKQTLILPVVICKKKWLCNTYILINCYVDKHELV